MFNPDYYEAYGYDIDDEDPVIYPRALNHICEHFEYVLSALYGEGELDVNELERSLDEVANGLGIRLPFSDLLIQRKRGA